MRCCVYKHWVLLGVFVLCEARMADRKEKTATIKTSSPHMRAAATSYKVLYTYKCACAGGLCCFVLEVCAGGDALCATLYAGGCGGYALFMELLEVSEALEVMRRVLYTLEVVGGGLCLLEVL